MGGVGSFATPPGPANPPAAPQYAVGPAERFFDDREHDRSPHTDRRDARISHPSLLDRQPIVTGAACLALRPRSSDLFCSA